MLPVMLLAVCLGAAGGDYLEDDWIDPTDMLNYDASSGKMRNRQQAQVEQPVVIDDVQQVAQSVCLAQREECEKTVEHLKQEISQYQVKEKSKTAHVSSSPVFKRYLRRILSEVEHLGLPDESQPEVHYDAELILTRQMLAEIQRFLEDADWTVGALDDALSKTFVQLKQHDSEAWRWKFEDYVGVEPFTAFMALLCVLCIVVLIATELWTHVGWVTQIVRLFTLCIFISFGMNWMYLYKVAFAERQAEMMKSEKFDTSCNAKISWTETLFGYLKSAVVFENDPCKEYYKAFMVNPALMVPPTKALALTFTDFITEPLKHIGKGIGEFMKALLSEIPVLLQIPVLIFLVAALLIFCYGTGRTVGQFHYLQRPQRDQPPAVDFQRTNNAGYIEDVNRQPPRQQGNQYQLEQRPHGAGDAPRAINQSPETIQPMDVIDNGRKQNSVADVSCGPMVKVAQTIITERKEKLNEEPNTMTQEKNCPNEEESEGQTCNVDTQSTESPKASQPRSSEQNTPEVTDVSSSPAT
ncbi:chloride channel CLIC-like protein 1 [Bombina bombina]|uniref:chloride channel CLIC-like protein 1 n=1 Tax=Bombina bombina TaxID=8345 RepID=UPI00235A8ED4|nr:chloride channel CLIC-like protein 1 [Bombina bombina]